MTRVVMAIACIVALASIAVAALFAPKAHAAGFNDEPTCYSWEGGHKSSGSFTKCPSGIPPAPTKVAAAAPAPIVVAPPVMSCPPVATPTPDKPKPVIKRKPKPVTC